MKQAEKIFQADRRNVVDRLVAAKHMGYSSLSGPAEKSIATLVQYGLLDRIGVGQVRISQTAMDILHPDNPKQRHDALSKAANSPEIFKSLNARFPEGVSPQSLESYLIRENFMDRAIRPIAKAFSETQLFLEQSGVIKGDTAPLENSEGFESFDDEDETPDSAESAQEAAPTPRTAPTTAQIRAATPGVGPLSASDMDHLPGEGMTRAAFPLFEGNVYLTFPSELSSEGYAELAEYLEIFLRRAGRLKRSQEAKSDSDFA
jgi:hypothetical protein